MTTLIAAYAGVFGLLIGSFLNVVIYRVPAGLSVVSPGSACPGCSKDIAWYDNIPVVSWLVLRAKCRSCAEPISARYPLVETATAALFVLLALVSPTYSLIPGLVLVGACCLALAIIDIETFRLPDPIVAATAGFAVVGIVIDGAVSGEWPLLRALASAGAWLAVFGIPWFLTAGRGMGFGDVKLAPSLGLLLGWVGWGPSLVGLLSGFVIGTVVGLAIHRGKRGKHIPYGPFMVIGALVGLIAGQRLWSASLDYFFPTLGA